MLSIETATSNKVHHLYIILPSFWVANYFSPKTPKIPALIDSQELMQYAINVVKVYLQSVNNDKFVIK